MQMEGGLYNFTSNSHILLWFVQKFVSQFDRLIISQGIVVVVYAICFFPPILSPDISMFLTESQFFSVGTVNVESS